MNQRRDFVNFPRGKIDSTRNGRLVRPTKKTEGSQARGSHVGLTPSLSVSTQKRRLKANSRDGNASFLAAKDTRTSSISYKVISPNRNRIESPTTKIHTAKIRHHSHNNAYKVISPNRNRISYNQKTHTAKIRHHSHNNATPSPCFYHRSSLRWRH